MERRAGRHPDSQILSRSIPISYIFRYAISMRKSIHCHPSHVMVTFSQSSFAPDIYHLLATSASAQLHSFVVLKRHFLHPDPTRPIIPSRIHNNKIYAAFMANASLYCLPACHVASATTKNLWPIHILRLQLLVDRLGCHFLVASWLCRRQGNNRSRDHTTTLLAYESLSAMKPTTAHSAAIPIQFNRIPISSIFYVLHSFASTCSCRWRS